ncbi:cytochrome P450 4c21-like [Arctopsyche grandis]|uniref:cytochrome P450 4c21-like n=1 Tax=Arctopsyche grandis TaxID=121162 RepID=UPI00406D79FB
MYVLSLQLQGPTSWPFLGSMLAIGQSWPSTDKMKILYNEHLKYLSPFRIWYFSKFVVVLTDPNDIQSLIEDNDVPLKPEMYYYWSRAIGNGLWTGHGGSTWRKNRLLLYPMFSNIAVTSYQKIVEKHHLVLKDVIMQHCGSETFDVKCLLERYSGNIMSEILLGDDLLQEENCKRLLLAMRKIRSLVNERMSKFWLHPDFLFKRSKCSRDTFHYRSTLEEYISKIYDEKKQEYFKCKRSKDKNAEAEAVPTALLGFIAAQNNSNHDLSDKKIIEEIMSIYVKATDSVFCFLTFFIMMISMEKKIQNKLTKEIAERIIDDGVINIENIEKMKYLNMCYKETLRLFPYGAFITKFADKDVKLSNKNITIPNGSVIVIPGYFININEKNWTKPLLYQPERFSEDDYCISEHFLPFGVGQRNCIGERMGSFLAKSTMAFLLEHFEFSTDTNFKDFQPTFDTSVRPPIECNIKVVKKNVQSVLST